MIGRPLGVELLLKAAITQLQVAPSRTLRYGRQVEESFETVDDQFGDKRYCMDMHATPCTYWRMLLHGNPTIPKVVKFLSNVYDHPF